MSEFRSEHTHPLRNRCQSNRVTDTPTQREAFRSAETSSPSLIKLISIAQLHSLHMHTKHKYIKVATSCLSNPSHDSNLLDLTSFSVISAAPMFAWQKILISRATQLHTVIPHIISHWAENPSPYKQPCSLVPASWHCAHCDWQASRRWSYTGRHNVVQWSLERTTGS